MGIYKRNRWLITTGDAGIAPTKHLLILGVLMSLLFGNVAYAQDNVVQVQTSVYITTQDYTSFREGPGQHFERTSVIDPAVTLPAIGRTQDSRWIEVVHNGETGWIYYSLVVWSGNLVELPVDGTTPQAFVRKIGVAGITSRDAPIYASQVDPSDQVGMLPADTPVEVVGRLGEGTFFQYQILVNDQLYWIGAWNVRITDGNYRSVLDNTYRYAYGRLVTQFNRDIREGQSRLRSIESIWRRLQNGEPVSCNERGIPQLLNTRQVSDGDVNSEPSFAPANNALDEAIGFTNTAIGAFADVCSRTDKFLTIQDVRDALENVGNARRYYNIAISLVNSLEVRDPVFN